MIFSLLDKLKQKQFTGIIDIISQGSKQNLQWKIYFCLGKLIWADGGIHTFRTLQRNVQKFCPQVDINKVNFTAYDKYKCKEYAFFSSLLQQEIIQQNQFNQIVTNQKNLLRLRLKK